ncbi:FAD-dependent monooxygenase [Cryptosporangium arvum]|uniref:2-polyprenyl-6-methoxyphenol hydroxylase-like oxidoreductase n=1 Tax=Cryptosporangium arvum DSM 44712 TaxID=927661 RepID=A0A010YII4_9ACTN|nr:FAD-dependent monooxygenase [Cryptosporangium arvum]EXG80070.1 2-polyprenyl-6-methoxyphenol hydroxylase-like oxidoreductase [Cryptosporangium arvum DSM 44712]
MTSVLISGAGVAGPTLAYWLARSGFRPTVVEVAAGLRSSGNPVDVRGPALPVARAMGLMEELREHATLATGMRVVGTDIRLPMARGDEIELARTDLAAVLYRASRDDAEFVFDDTITALHEDRTGVDVSFARGTPRRFDYVIGADGLHSTVRRLAFGPEERFVHHAGLYIATVTLGGAPADPHDVMIYNRPRRLVALHPARGEAGAAFIFRGPALPASEYRDPERQKTIVTTMYRDDGWRVPELLDAVRNTTDLYFDAVSAVRLPRWSTPRVALVGDAASCVSLLGDGSSLAMAGAHTLASALANGGGFAAYEAEHRKLTTPKQRRIALAAGLLVPKTSLGIAVRNTIGRLGTLTRRS